MDHLVPMMFKKDVVGAIRSLIKGCEALKTLNRYNKYRLFIAITMCVIVDLKSIRIYPHEINQ